MTPIVHAIDARAFVVLFLCAAPLLALTDRPVEEPRAPPAAFAPPPAVRHARKHGVDIIDCHCFGGHYTVAEQARRAAEDEGRVSKADVVRGMAAIKGRVAACYDRFRVPGMANVSLTITSEGLPTKVSVSGSFSGTATGACVEEAVGAARFPTAKYPRTINYPFMLR